MNDARLEIRVIKVGRLTSLLGVLLSILVILLLPSAIASGDNDGVDCGVRAAFILDLTVSNIIATSNSRQS